LQATGGLGEEGMVWRDLCVWSPGGTSRGGGMGASQAGLLPVGSTEEGAGPTSCLPNVTAFCRGGHRGFPPEGRPMGESPSAGTTSWAESDCATGEVGLSSVAWVRSAFCLLPGPLASAFCLLPGPLASAFCLLPGPLASDFCLLPGPSCLLPSVWIPLFSAWCLVPGAWCLVPGAWGLVAGVLCLDRLSSVFILDPSLRMIPCADADPEGRGSCCVSEGRGPRANP